MSRLCRVSALNAMKQKSTFPAKLNRVRVFTKCCVDDESTYNRTSVDNSKQETMTQTNKILWLPGNRRWLQEIKTFGRTLSFCSSRYDVVKIDMVWICGQRKNEGKWIDLIDRQPYGWIRYINASTHMGCKYHVTGHAILILSNSRRKPLLLSRIQFKKIRKDYKCSLNTTIAD